MNARQHTTIHVTILQYEYHYQYGILKQNKQTLEHIVSIEEDTPHKMLINIADALQQQYGYQLNLTKFAKNATNASPSHTWSATEVFEANNPKKRSRVNKQNPIGHLYEFHMTHQPTKSSIHTTKGA